VPAAERGDGVGVGEPLQEPVRRWRSQTGPPSPRRPRHRRGPSGGGGAPHRGAGRPQRGPAVVGQPAANLATLVDPTVPWSRSTPFPSSPRGRGLAPSRAVGSATVSTTSWSPTTWPGGWSAAASNDTGCGGHRPTSTAGPVGYLPADHRRSSGSLRPRRHLRRHQHLTSDIGPSLAAGRCPAPMKHRVHGHDGPARSGFGSMGSPGFNPAVATRSIACACQQPIVVCTWHREAGATPTASQMAAAQRSVSPYFGRTPAHRSARCIAQRGRDAATSFVNGVAPLGLGDLPVIQCTPSG
jgi:hypothetical protein